MALVQVSDVVVPAIFTPYTQQLTEQKARMIQSGALARDSMLDDKLAGGGLTFNVPSWRDLADTADVVSTDADVGGGDITPDNLGTSQEIAVRLSRNQAWRDADLASALAGSDAGEAVAQRVAFYWARRLQAAFVATITGVFADNAAAPAGSEHVQDDMTNDVSGAGFEDGVTNFTAEALIDAAGTMGDSLDELALLMVHSTVYTRMQKLNLIDFIPDADQDIRIPTFLGQYQVLVDDALPNSAGVFDSWLFGAGSVRLGMGTPEIADETDRHPEAGGGAGASTLHSRRQWAIHPVGLRYNGTAANGGPSNAATANNLAHEDSWFRVYSERKQIKIARLITRES